MITAYTKNRVPYVVLISACKGESYEHDVLANAELFNMLWTMKHHRMEAQESPVEFKAVTGYYNGTREASYMVSFSDPSLVEVFVYWAEWFKQECILVREFMANGLPIINLINPEFKRTAIGSKFVKIGNYDDMMLSAVPMPEACTIIGTDIWVVA